VAPAGEYASGVTRDEWIAGYGSAWERADADAAASLFTEDALYRSSPFRPPSVGHDGIREYWQQATATQSGVRVRFGEPIASGDKLAVEWWTTMRSDGADVTLPGCLVLRFAPDGRCEELREYWHWEERSVDPPPGWGA
jgi:ketosteroid isomerase-like protein